MLFFFFFESSVVWGVPCCVLRHLHTMSLITAFPFQAFQCDLNRDVAHTKLGVSLSAMTSQEMHRAAFVQVKVRIGKESKTAPWRPVVRNGEEQATFWDPRMGNFDIKGFPPQPCATCSVAASGNTPAGPARGMAAAAATNQRCSGHFGYISMPAVSSDNWLAAYNPLLYADLVSLVQSTCYFCHGFRVPTWDLVRHTCALTLLDGGYVGEALHLLDTFPSSKTSLANNKYAKRLRDPNSESVHDVDVLHEYVNQVLKAHAGEPSVKETKLCVVDIRNEMVEHALREFRLYSPECSRCGAVSPKITNKHSQIYAKFVKAALDRDMMMGVVTQAQVEDWASERKLYGREHLLLSSHDVCKMTADLCSKHADVMAVLFPTVGGATVDVPYRHLLPPERLFEVFFLDRVLVPPLPLRLASGIQVQAGGSISPDEHTRVLNDILKYTEEIEEYYALVRQGNASVRQHIANEQNVKSLQLKVDEMYSQVLSSFAKKEGLFRMHMMGKRVNQACRSVISPDFTVEPNEVVLPRPFAKNLSFPEQVTSHSAARTELLRRCIINGPNKYPGATHVELHSANGNVQTAELAGNEQRRREVAEKYLAMARSGNTVIVYRHVLDNDRLIFNRQPTLHKPSMQSYRARVLSGLRTLRFHYVSGKSYNADFDGDEMNVHVPQSLECRAELETIMDANLNFIVPTSGQPIRGLIQDHLAAGVMLTCRDKFYDYDMFTQLLFVGLQPYLGSAAASGITLVPPPAIFKPQPLWSGKQLISAILRFHTGVLSGTEGVSLQGRTSVPASAWTRGNKNTDPLADDVVVVLNSELLRGVLDKSQLGPSKLSIPHIVYEVYGPHRVGDLFGSLGRVLTFSLQLEGFTMAVDDMLLHDKEGRRLALEKLDSCAFGAPTEAEAVQRINKQASSMTQSFIPFKMILPFPANKLILMTVSGAKGSNVNATQMSLVLGQQFFDGLRVKRMCSGKTLPGFFANEERARSFGFAFGRFLSGIRPHEYTIHAMAGRDGLIDTAIKTSRSGHLQRCLIKGLESLTVRWDRTVRDSNGSVVQFNYGGDGLDPMKSSTLQAWDASYRNLHELEKRYGTASKETIFDLPAHFAASLQNAKLRIPLNPRVILRALQKGQSLPEKLGEHEGYAKDRLHILTEARLKRASCDPGEPVGLLAAQAAGEPSTQMTLNTFHQAGATVSHVTQGIPRLRELLIYASVSRPAVLVPVKGASSSELSRLHDILGSIAPVLLREALAPIKEPCQWTVTRYAQTTAVSIHMLFSQKLLKKLGDKQHASTNDHTLAFIATLRSYARSLAKNLRGASRNSEAEGGAGGETVQDPADLELPADAKQSKEGEEEGDQQEPSEQSDASSGEEEVEEVAENVEAPVECPTGQAEGEPGDDASQAESDEKPDEECESNAEDEQESVAAPKKVSYNSFPPLTLNFNRRTIKAEVEPHSFATSDPSDAARVEEWGLFVVTMSVVMPSSIVAVIADVVSAAFEETIFPAHRVVHSAQFVPQQSDPSSGELIFQGKGVTLRSVFAILGPYADECPSMKLMKAVSTDVHDVASALGIEGAYGALLSELAKVFSQYSVDHHHLSLIADAATHRGRWEAYNFNGVIARSSSPLFQMTFASSKRFLHTALTRGVSDNLTSLSSAIMVGQLPPVGTATVDVRVAPLAATVAERTPSALASLASPRM